jgi:nucleoside-diphosphate-sugar epimerase
MRIGIIGCGYVGQAVASKWKKDGHIVSATTRKPERVNELKQVVHEVFLLQTGNLSSFLATQDVILISVAPELQSQSTYQSTYLKTAEQVLEGLCYSHSLKQILYTSSTSVYGDHQGAWVDEACSIFPMNDQTRILHETEQLLLSQQSNRLQVCILRLGEIYGPQRRIEDRLRRMQGRAFPGTGENYTNLIHLDDVVKALDFAIQQSLTGIYNLCNDCHIPRKDFYEAICQKEGLTNIQWDPIMASIHGGNKRVSTQKLKDLGFSIKEQANN